MEAMEPRRGRRRNCAVLPSPPRAPAASCAAMLRCSAAPLILLAACHGAPSMPESPPLAAGVTPGLVSFDPTPSEGAHTWDAPTWHKGDHFELLWGGCQSL